MKTFEFTVGEEGAEKRVDQYLAKALAGEASRTEIQRVIKEHGVILNRKPLARSNAVLKKGDELVIRFDEPQRLAPRPADLPLDIVYEDDDLMVINKSTGVVVHPAPGHRQDTIVNALLASGRDLSDAGGADRPGVVHRLDKDTSGLLIIAKNNHAHRKLSRMFQERSIEKTYHAIVAGKVGFEQGLIEASIGRHPKERRKMAVSSASAAREAFTEYRVLKRFRYSSYLEVKLLTGRTHQIRVHFAHIGHPVLGDAMYGGPGKYPRMALHAFRLRFEHPDGRKQVACEAPLPEDFLAMLESEKQR